MDFNPSRLRRGELLVGAAAALLLFSLLVLPWYGVKSVYAPTLASLGQSTTVNGWDGFTHLHWLVLVTVAVSFALVYHTATRRTPAIPVSLAVIVTVLALLTTLWILYRVVINVPGSDQLVVRKVGGFIGLASGAAIFFGGYQSLRDEGLPGGDAPQEVETVRLTNAGGS